MKIIKYFILILIALLSIKNIYSQEKQVSDNWLSLGTGIGEKKMISGFFSYTIANDNIYQISLNGNQEFSVFRLRDPNYIVSTTFAYGNKIEWSFIFGGLFYGPSLVFGKKKGENIKYTLGININSQTLFSPSDVLGIGIDIFGNINFYEPFFGVRMAFYFRTLK